MTTTHTLHPANLKVGHVRGVMPLPVSLVGTHELTAEDRETVDAAIESAVRRVLPKAQRLDMVWRPSGRTVDVWLHLAIRTNGSSKARVATFGVRPVQP